MTQGEDGSASALPSPPLSLLIKKGAWGGPFPLAKVTLSEYPLCCCYSSCVGFQQLSPGFYYVAWSPLFSESRSVRTLAHAVQWRLWGQRGSPPGCGHGDELARALQIPSGGSVRARNAGRTRMNSTRWDCLVFHQVLALCQKLF